MGFFWGGPRSFGESWDHAALGCWAFCHVAQEAGETLPGRKGVKGFLLVGHEKVPHGVGLSGDHGGYTADGAGTEGLLELQTSTSFPEIQYREPGRGRRKDCVHLWVF